MGTQTLGTSEDNIGVSFVEEQQDSRRLGLPFIQPVVVTGGSAARELHYITHHPCHKTRSADPARKHMLIRPTVGNLTPSLDLDPQLTEFVSHQV